MNDHPARTNVPTHTDIIDFESSFTWQRGGSKTAAIGILFGISETRYYQLLNEAIDDPVQLARQPVLVNRLRRQRNTRQRRHSRFGGDR